MAPHRFIAFFSLLGALLSVAGCRSREAEEGPMQKALREKGTLGVLDQVAKSPQYSPPADGRLTERQVELFLEVRRREQKIREAALGKLRAKTEGPGTRSPLGSLGDMSDAAMADLRAVVELGVNPREYQWIKERVLEVELLESTQTLLKGQESVIQMLENQKKLARSDEERARIDRQIREIRESPGASSTPAKEENAALLARYKNEFEQIQAAEARRVQTTSSEESHEGR